MTSKIKVDNINKVSDDSNIINRCGTTVTVGSAPGNLRAGTNNIQAADGGNLISQCGATITLGASGDTIQLASGASQSGFGRTGTVDWITTPKVTGDSPVTAVSGNGYFLNTTAGTITVNLPAGSAGDIVSFADYAATWQTYAVTVTPNGTEKIGGQNSNATLNTEGQSVTFVYVDSVQGWINTMDSTSNERGSGPYVEATVTGACNTLTVAPCCANVKIATFLAPGTFCVSSGGSAAPCSGTGSNLVDYMVVAGGGAGQDSDGPGAGGGGFRESPGTASGSYSVSPLGAAPAVSLPVSAQGYSITVGGGGAASATAGNDSIFSTITSAGGGAGNPTSPTAGDGGSGSGGYAIGGAGGNGNTPPVNPPQGQNGGTGGSGSPTYSPGGGGGAGGTGGNAPPTSGGAGGVGVPTSITGSAVAYAGGGGGGRDASRGGSGGPSSPCSTGGAAPGGSGTANRGGGGGGGENTPSSGAGNGGSGIVVIRYKFQN